MTNREVRIWYQREVAKIADLDRQWRAEGVAVEERARRAWRIRHNARLGAREKMANQEEVELLRRRDEQLYGHPDGPTFEQLVQEQRRAGFADDEAFERVVTGAATTNEDVNRRIAPNGETGQ